MFVNKIFVMSSWFETATNVASSPRTDIDVSQSQLLLAIGVCPKRSRGANGKRSFTLLELLMVIAIISIISMMAVPLLVQRPTAILAYELEKLTTILAYLQQRALATNQEQVLVIDAVRNEYRVVSPSKTVTYSLAKDLEWGFISGAYGPPSNPITPLTQVSTFPGSNNLFNIKIIPNGNISPGAVYLTDHLRRVMGALTCSISQVSYIRAYLYNSGRWHLCNLEHV